MINVLILCTGNSCRSIIAEVLFNDLGQGRVTAYSAGSQPTGDVNPGAIEILERHGHDTTGVSSKSWDGFADAGAETLDIVITVCDSAAREQCPVWPGAPVRANWGIPDPAAADPAAAEAAFAATYAALRERIDNTLQLPLDSMDPRALADALARIHDASVGRER